MPEGGEHHLATASRDGAQNEAGLAGVGVGALHQRQAAAARSSVAKFAFTKSGIDMGRLL